MKKMPKAGEVNPLLQIPRDRLDGMIGKQIHLSWAGRGCVWVLESIEGNTMILRTPVSKRVRRAAAYDACYTRLHEACERARGM